MENTLNTEQELSQHEETQQEVPPMQQPEAQPAAKTAPETQDPLKKVQDELAEAKDKYVRLYAEFENHRRRTAKEKLEMIQGANEQLLKALLPVADDFERAEKSFKDRSDKEAEGFFLIHNKFRKVLESYGVKAMETGQGSEFNADIHEAITQIPAPNESLKGKIIDVVEKGYLLNEKVIRFAKVVVGN
ncbi:MAG: nucleotide exchange factor GrpE [Bacteroidetes bacterium]|nr:nucleotide exchange factor GrpE [Bacteroidota bacterium]MBS1976169.1 nucleotide exchange factor GrpE [Bacteroidota bacterium]